MTQENERTTAYGLPAEGEAGEPDEASNVGGAVDQAKSMAGDAADKAKETVESGRESTADAIDNAATSLRDRAPSEGAAGAVAGKAADGMEAAAGYLKEHETGEILSDLEEYVRAHPMQAVAGAVVAGFVLGRAMR